MKRSQCPPQTRIIDFEKELTIAEICDAFRLFLRHLTSAELEIILRSLRNRPEVSQNDPASHIADPAS